MDNIYKFEYRELGNKDKVRAYSLELEEGVYVFKIRKDNKTFSLNKEEVEKIFAKYDFTNLTVDSMYPFKVKDEIDYRIKITFSNYEVLDFNGYSHYPDFYNDFISDLSRLIPGRIASSLKVKDEMLDKDKKYITNYVEKISVYTPSGDLIISKDRLTEEEYDVDVSLGELNKYFKKEDLNFVLPINVHYFTYAINKLCNFHEGASPRKGDYDYYIDIRLHNKKHRYYDLADPSNIESLIKLIEYLKLYSKLNIFEALYNQNFAKEYLSSHNLPKTKAEVNDEFIKYLDEGKTLLDALKIVAKNNSNFSMYELISFAYMNQEFYYVYTLDENKKINEFIVNAENEKELNKYFKKKDFNDLLIKDLNKDYDVIYYKEDSIYHIAIVSSKYEDLKFLKLKESLREELIHLVD